MKQTWQIKYNRVEHLATPRSVLHWSALVASNDGAAWSTRWWWMPQAGRSTGGCGTRVCPICCLGKSWSRVEKKEGSWLLSISMNCNMQTPERNAIKQTQDWKQQMTVLLARCDLVLLRQCDGEQSCSSRETKWWMKPKSSVKQVYRAKDQCSFEKQRCCLRDQCVLSPFHKTYAITFEILILVPSQ